MFECCLAPDTLGDGTGCDNMTCIITTFNKSDSASSGSIKRRASDEGSAEPIDQSSEAKKAKPDSTDEDK